VERRKSFTLLGIQEDGGTDETAVGGDRRTRAARQIRNARAQFRDSVKIRSLKDDRAQARICAVFHQLQGC